MPKIAEITNLGQFDQPGMNFWGIAHPGVDNEGHIMYFPLDTVEWRAAEYDLDASTPEAREDIYDMIIHEFFVPRTALKTLKQNAKGIWVNEDAVHLYNAPTKANALEAHRERLGKVKQSIIDVRWPDRGKPFQKNPAGQVSMRQRLCDHQPDGESIEAKRAHVWKTRVALGLEKPAIVIPMERSVPWDPTLEKAVSNRKVIERG